MSKIDDVVCDELNSNTNKENTMDTKISFMKLVRELVGEGQAIAARLPSKNIGGWRNAVDKWQSASEGKDLCIIDYKRMVEVALELTMLQTKVANLQATIASLESTLAGKDTATIITPKEYKPIEKFSVKVRFFVNPEEGVVADDTETHAYIGIGEEDEDHPEDNTIFFYTKLTAEAFMKQHTKENSTEDFYVVEIAD